MALTTKISKGRKGLICSFRTDVSGDNTIIPAPGAGMIICVTSFAIIGVGGSVGVYFKTGSDTHFGGSDISASLNSAGPLGGLFAQRDEDGHFSGGSGEALKLTLSSAVAVFGKVGYVIIPG